MFMFPSSSFGCVVGGQTSNGLTTRGHGFLSSNRLSYNVRSWVSSPSSSRPWVYTNSRLSFSKSLVSNPSSNRSHVSNNNNKQRCVFFILFPTKVGVYLCVFLKNIVFLIRCFQCVCGENYFLKRKNWVPFFWYNLKWQIKALTSQMAMHLHP